MDPIENIIEQCQKEVPAHDKRFIYGLHNFLKQETEYSRIFIQVLEAFPALNLHGGPWLAGGALRRLVEGTEKYNGWDFDIFFQNDEQRRYWRQDFLKPRRHKCIATTPRAETYVVAVDGRDVIVQITTKRNFYSYPQLLDSFDFTNSMLVCDQNIVKVGQYTLADIKSRDLFPNKFGLQDGYSTLLRFAKFGAEGYTIQSQAVKEFLVWVQERAPKMNLLEPKASSDPRFRATKDNCPF